MVSLLVRFPNVDRYTPLIFVLSQGTDPMAEFVAFSRDRGMEERVAAISLGQGQGPVAERAIAEATRTGDWVFLQVGTMFNGLTTPALRAIFYPLPNLM